MNDSRCLGVTHFARWRGGEREGRAPGEICSGQRERHRAGAGLGRCDFWKESQGERKRYLRADPATQERAEMSPRDARISRNHSISQHPSLCCPSPAPICQPVLRPQNLAPVAVPPCSGIRLGAKTPCRCNQSCGCCALPPDPPNSSMPHGTQQDGQGGQLPTMALGARVGDKGDPSHGLQHRAWCLTLSLPPHL